MNKHTLATKKPYIKNMNIFNLTIFFFLSSWQNNATAEIFKYQDQYGNWKFTDKPPHNNKKAQAVSYKSSHNKKTLDYKKSLLKKYNPQSPLESATLAVVTIKTKVGSGSGFFISDDCYLVTNKHVVRPTSTKKWKESEKNLENDKSDLKEAKRYIDEERERLEINSKKLIEYRDYVDDLRSGREKDNEDREYQHRLRTHNKDIEDLDKKIKKTKKQNNEFKLRDSDFLMNSSISAITNSFKIIFKDNSKANAKLVQIAKNKDLALLKIDQCKTSFLTLNYSLKPYQGMNIYAIGSPLGLSDHVTSGVITNINKEGISTDAQILPGNSGGPLITPKGEVIGVNTQKITEGNVNSEGFGIAIPAKQVYQTFRRYIK